MGSEVASVPYLGASNAYNSSRYFRDVILIDPHEALENSPSTILTGYFRWLLRQSRGSIESSQSAQTLEHTMHGAQTGNLPDPY